MYDDEYVIVAGDVNSMAGCLNTKALDEDFVTELFVRFYKFINFEKAFDSITYIMAYFVHNGVKGKLHRSTTALHTNVKVLKCEVQLTDYINYSKVIKQGIFVALYYFLLLFKSI